MPEISRWRVPIPDVSLSTYIFGDPLLPLSNETAYVDVDQPLVLKLTWSTLRHWSQRFAAGLQAAGLQKGDRVLVYSSNDILMPVLLHGTIMAGGVYSAANARFFPRELAFQLQNTDPKFVLASYENLSKALEAVKMAGLSEDRVFLFDHVPLEMNNGGQDHEETGVCHWKALIASAEVGSKFRWEEIKGEETKIRPVGLMFSSGTTGLPKGVETCHYNLIANAVQTDYVMSLDPKLSTRKQAAENSRWLCTIPLYHGLGLCYFMIIAAVRRIPTYIMRQYNLDRMLDAIQAHKITELHVVPPIVLEMTKHKGIKSGKADVSSVTGTFSCGAPLGSVVTLEYESIWPKSVMSIKQAFGMTELNGIGLGCDPTTEVPPGSVGEPMPNIEARLVDDNFKDVKSGERGELWLRGPNIMKGYWHNKEVTAQTITEDGWLKTGDVAVRDPKGWYFIVDRKKDLIKVKGNQVAPAELEALILDHPAVADVAVIGVKRDEDEVPGAYVVPSSPITEHEIQQYVNERVQSVKRLRGGVYFTKSIPRNPSGKILRSVLRHQHRTSSSPNL